jgi:hypothetical protein
MDLQQTIHKHMQTPPGGNGKHHDAKLKHSLSNQEPQPCLWGWRPWPSHAGHQGRLAGVGNPSVPPCGETPRKGAIGRGPVASGGRTGSAGVQTGGAGGLFHGGVVVVSCSCGRGNVTIQAAGHT